MGGVTDVILVPGYPGYAEIRTVGGQLAIVWNMSSLGPAGTGNDTATLRFQVTLTPGSPGVYVLNRGQDLTAKGRYSNTVVSDTADLDVVVSAYRRDVAAVSQTPLKKHSHPRRTRWNRRGGRELRRLLCGDIQRNTIL